jgi:hypothetical protein
MESIKWPAIKVQTVTDNSEMEQSFFQINEQITQPNLKKKDTEEVGFTKDNEQNHDKYAIPSITL